MNIVGLDIGRTTAYACVLPDPFPADFKQFVQRYKPIRATADESGIQTIAQIGDIFALEPTGTDHWVWYNQLRKQGKLVLLCSGMRIRAEARRRGFLNKSDREDAAIIAAYTYQALKDGEANAFLEIEDFELRDWFRAMRAIPKTRTRIINQVRARLSKECPELAKATATPRNWMQEQPTSLWRKVAADPGKTIGKGISWYTQELAATISKLEELEYRAEVEANERLRAECYQPYCEVFQRWGIPERTQIALLSEIYPLEKFLEGGRVVHDKVWSVNDEGVEKQTGRNRSLARFKRILGCGKVRVQSGDKEFFITTGDSDIRGALYGFLERRVVVGRQIQSFRMFKKFGQPPDWESWSKAKQKEWTEQYNFRTYLKDALLIEQPWNDQTLIKRVTEYNDVPEPIARLQLLYEFHPNCQNLKKEKRLLKIYPRFCKWLFNDLYFSLKKR